MSLAYPTHENLPVKETASNLINRTYLGSTSTTVSKHLIKAKRAFDESIEWCNKRISESVNDKSKTYWCEVLKYIESLYTKCNLDYKIYIMKDMTIEEIVEKYNDVTIGDIKKSRKYLHS